MKSNRRCRRWSAVSLTAWGLLMSGSPLQAGPTRRVTTSPAIAKKATAAPTAATTTNIEVAWLAEPALFKCRLRAKIAKDAIEVCGFVPNEAVGKQALEVAQSQFEGKVVSRLQAQQGMLLNFGLPCEPSQLAAAATARLSEQMGDKLIGLQLSCPKVGCIELTGTVASDADRLELSKCLQGLTGCTHVVNRTTTDSYEFEHAPMKVAAPQPTATEQAKPAIVRSDAPKNSSISKLQAALAEGPKSGLNDGPELEIKPEAIVKAPARIKEAVTTSTLDGPALPLVPAPVPIIQEVEHREVVAQPSTATVPPTAPSATKPNIGRAMIVVPAIEDENTVEQKPAMPVPPTVVATVIHERRPEIVPLLSKQAPVTEAPAPTFEAAAPKQEAPVPHKCVPAPVSSMPEWKSIPVDSRTAAPTAEINLKKVEFVAPAVAAPTAAVPAAPQVHTTPSLPAPVHVAPEAPKVVELPKVIVAPKCADPIDAPKAAISCAPPMAPTPVAIAAPINETPKPIEILKASPVVITPEPPKVVCLAAAKPEVEKAAPVAVAPAVQAMPIVELTKTQPASAPTDTQQSGFAANRAAKTIEPVTLAIDPTTTARPALAEAKMSNSGQPTKANECPGTIAKTDCHFHDSKPIVSLASFSKNGQTAAGVAKPISEKQLGVVRVPLSSGHSPVSQESARAAVEALCRGDERKFDVRTTGAQQLTLTMKVKSHTEWSDLHKKMKSLSEIAGYSLVYRVDVGEGSEAIETANPSHSSTSVSMKQSAAPMMGVIRGKSTGNPLDPDTVRSVIETMCKVHSHDVNVTAAGMRQVSIAMKVANPADWDQLYTRIRQMPEIADYAVIFNVRVQ